MDPNEPFIPLPAAPDQATADARARDTWQALAATSPVLAAAHYVRHSAAIRRAQAAPPPAAPRAPNPHAVRRVVRGAR